MEVYDCIKSRRSVRSYAKKDVEEEKLTQVLEAARLAPSASNRQNWKFIVVRDKSLRALLAEAAYAQTFIGEAPVVIVACATKSDHIMPCGHASHLIDVAIAVDHMTLAARELGLGTCWIGAFKHDEVKQVLGIPGPVQVVALTPLGYPTSWPRPTPRKSLDEVVCYDGWK